MNTLIKRYDKKIDLDKKELSLSSSSPQQNLKQNAALQFVILIGLVSLFSDMVYEGARSSIGPLFAMLGASGAIVGFVAGFGELAGNALRMISGYWVDRSQQYWLITFIGYGCLFAIPLLAFVHTWEIAAVLIIIERIGKAIRTPARDAMLSYATQKMGRGFGFGLHQVFDQIGGMLGPFIMLMVLIGHRSYAVGFAILFLPAIITLVVLALGKTLYRDPQRLETTSPGITSTQIPTAFWIYLIAACFMAAGYADFPLIAFHFEKAKLFTIIWIPIFYMIALATSGLSALFFGWLYDRIGLISLMIAIPLFAMFAPCVFFDGFWLALLGMILWGIGMGAQKSLLKAVVGDMIAKSKRGTAFGLFNAGYGFAWFAGSWLIGVLYDISIHDVIVFSIAMELLAIPFVYAVYKIKK